MNKIDERYLKILARFAPKKVPNRTKNMGTLSFIIVFIGGMLEVAGHYYGWVIMAAGLIILTAGIILNNKAMKKAESEFLEYYGRTGELPPWPGEENDNASSETRAA